MNDKLDNLLMFAREMMDNADSMAREAKEAGDDDLKMRWYYTSIAYQDMIVRIKMERDNERI